MRFKLSTFSKTAVGLCVAVVVLTGTSRLIAQQPAPQAQTPLAPPLSFTPKFAGETGTFSRQSGPVGTYQLGPITFHIPAGYQPSYYKAGTNDGAGAIMMFALLPDLSPRTEENKAEFDAPGWGRKVEISIQYKQGPYTGNKLLKIYTMENDSAIVPNSGFKDGAYEIQTLGIKTDKGIVPGVDDLFTNTQSFQPNFFICDRQGTGMWANVIPACHVIEPRHLELFQVDDDGKNLMPVEYIFQRKYADSVQNIDTKINKLIDSFESFR